MQFKLQKRVTNHVHADRIMSQNVNAFRYIERFQYHEHYSTIISNDYKHIFKALQNYILYSFFDHFEFLASNIEIEIIRAGLHQFGSREDFFLGSDFFL